jgi:hypothetical protein
VEPEARDFSWAVALKHVAVVVLLLVLAGMGLVTSGKLQDPDVARDLVGKIAIWAVLATLLASYGQQTGRSAFFVLGLVLAAVAILGPLPQFFAAMRQSRPLVPLRATEAAAFFRSQGRLCQPALGVTVADPGESFAVDAESAREINSRFESRSLGARLHSWVWTDPATGQRLEVAVAKDEGEQAETFTAFETGLRKALVRKGLKVEAERSTVLSKPYQYQLALSRPGVAVDVECVAQNPADAATAATGASAANAANAANAAELFTGIICLQTWAADHDLLRRVRGSLAFGDCR